MLRLKWLFILLLTVVGFWFATATPPCSEKCRNIFASDVYDSYREQLTPGAILGQTAQEKWAEHQRFVQTLREHPTDELVTRAFMGSDLTQAFQDYLAEQLPARSESDFFVYLTESLAKLRQSPQFNGIEVDLPQEDTFLRGNLPFLQYVLSNPQKTKVLRMAMPVIEQPLIGPWFIQRKVAPEFLQFLHSSPSHLYVNLMKRHGMEGGATALIENLEEQIPTLSVVTLDKNSAFYWQEANYQDQSESTLFKHHFLAKLQQNKGDFFWSKNLSASWPEELQTIIDQVHHTYFENRPVLTQTERQDFIELTYIALLEKLTQFLQPTSMNITCKQSMDRGPSLAILWQWKLGKASEEQVAALLLAPPLLIRNRPSHIPRIERFISAAKRL